MTKSHYLNAPPSSHASPHVPVEEAKNEFARRLQNLRSGKGWNQSELARRASKFLPGKKNFGRDNISCYERAVSIPRSEHLLALAKALGVNPADLVPSRGVASVDNKSAPLVMQDLGDGRVWLRLNGAVPWDAALEIIRKVKEANGTAD